MNETAEASLAALVLTAITEKYITVDLVTGLIGSLLCGILGVAVYLASSLLKGENSSPSMRCAIGTFFFSGLLGISLGNLLFPYFNYTGYILTSSLVGFVNKKIVNADLKEFLKIIINSWVSITKREKISTNDLNIEETSTGGKNNNAYGNYYRQG